MTPSAKVYVAGHTGLVGSAIVRRLQAAGYENIVTRRSSELDLLLLGSRGYGALRRTLLGSVSAALVRDAGCAVAVVP